MIEEWKDIKGYEGLYKVSNYGKVKSLKNNKILKPINCHDYKYVHLCDKNHKRKNKAIHRLVAQAFIDDNSVMQVNHINGNKSDNCITNLEWCTSSENNYHKTKVLLRGCKRVKCLETGRIFNSIEEAATFYSRKQNVLVAVLRHYKYNNTFAGYHWEYVD